MSKLFIHAWLLCILFLCNITLFTDDACIYYGQNNVTYTSQPIPIAALSNQGAIDFTKHAAKTNAPSYADNFSSQNPSSGSLHYTTHTGSMQVSGSIDPLSIVYLICNSPTIIAGIAKLVVEGASRLFDTTGKYERQKKAQVMEEYLYRIDQDRQLIYISHNLEQAIRQDFIYLEKCIEELSIATYARATPSGCYHTYCQLEQILRETYRALLQRHPRTHEQQLKADVRIAQYALEVAQKTDFKDKKTKKQAVENYRYAYTSAEENLNNFNQKQVYQREAEQRAYYIQTTFITQKDDLCAYCYNQQKSIIDHDTWYARAHNRCTTFNTLSGIRYTTQTYTLSDNALTSLHAYNFEIAPLQTITGNAYQQLIHQELLHIIEATGNAYASPTLVRHQEALVTCSVSAIMYNQAGESLHATRIADLCWTLLDYGNAAAEGIGLGLCTAVLHMATHPIETTLYTVAGPYMTAYHLSTLLYSVLDIGITQLYDTHAAQEKWDNFTKPVTDIYAALTDKELSTRDAIKAGTALATTLYAQTKLIGGLKKLCSGIVEEVTVWARTNLQVTPKEYLATTDGVLQKASIDPVSGGQMPSYLPPVDVTSETFKKALDFGTHKNKIKHFFDKEMHNFEALLEKLEQDKKLLVHKVLQALYESNKLPIAGKFEDIVINVEGYNVYARGFIDNNVIKLGTIFIPKANI